MQYLSTYRNTQTRKKKNIKIKSIWSSQHEVLLKYIRQQIVISHNYDCLFVLIMTIVYTYASRLLQFEIFFKEIQIRSNYK